MTTTQPSSYNAETVQRGQRWEEKKSGDIFHVVEVGSRGARGQFESGQIYTLAFDYFAGCNLLPVLTTVTLLVHLCKQARTIKVSFHTDEDAAAYIERKSATCAFEEAHPIPDTWTKTLEALDPTCEHGLSLRLCAGPSHYPMDM